MAKFIIAFFLYSVAFCSLIKAQPIELVVHYPAIYDANWNAPTSKAKVYWRHAGEPGYFHLGRNGKNIRHLLTRYSESKRYFDKFVRTKKTSLHGFIVGGVTLGTGLAMLASSSSGRRNNTTLQTASTATVAAGVGICLYSWVIRFKLMPNLRKSVKAYNNAEQLEGRMGWDLEGGLGVLGVGENQITGLEIKFSF